MAGVGVRHHHLAGQAALDALCSLAHRQRHIHPTGGLWEAADLQWWWRCDQRGDPSRTVVWFDAAGPVAAVFLTTMRTTALDVIVLHDALVDEVRAVATRLVAREPGAVETSFADDDPDWTAWARGLGFTVAGDRYVTTWLAAGHRPAIPSLAPGYRLRSRAELDGAPHHLIPRNGEHVAERLAECPLYRHDLDLAAFGPGGDVAAYGLFWADLDTGVGLVEPMRTEDAHQARGLARHLLATGLDRLAGVGCTRFKVSYLAGNTPAERLYLGAGFVPVASERTLRRAG